MAAYDLSNPVEWQACIEAFLDAHPAHRAQSAAVSARAGTSEVYLSTPMMVEFLDWCRRQHYLTSMDARHAITRIRQLDNAVRNQRQTQAGDSAL